MIKEEEKDKSMKLISTNQNITDASNCALIAKEQNGYLKQLNKPKNSFTTINPYSNKNKLSLSPFLVRRKQTVIDLSPEFRSSIVKSFKEDEDSNESKKQIETVINKTNSYHFSIKPTPTESSDRNNNIKKSALTNVTINDKDHRRLNKRERIVS